MRLSKYCVRLSFGRLHGPSWGKIIGYVYAGVEEKSWKELREAARFIHDVVVTERLRRHGIAEKLIEAAAEWLVARGVERVMLWAAEANAPAQQLFAKLDFRRTMVETTREAGQERNR